MHRIAVSKDFRASGVWSISLSAIGAEKGVHMAPHDETSGVSNVSAEGLCVDKEVVHTMFLTTYDKEAYVRTITKTCTNAEMCCGRCRWQQLHHDLAIN